MCLCRHQQIPQLTLEHFDPAPNPQGPPPRRVRSRVCWLGRFLRWVQRVQAVMAILQRSRIYFRLGRLLSKAKGTRQISE